MWPHKRQLSYLSITITMDQQPSSMQHRATRHRQIQLRLSRIAALIVTIIVTSIASILQTRVTEPWHTSILTGEMWVMELLAGHPEHIRTELGVHSHVFYALIDELRDMGCTDSKYVSLEEQLAIFLYCSVTGLTVRHLGERFQRSNDTITR